MFYVQVFKMYNNKKELVKLNSITEDSRLLTEEDFNIKKESIKNYTLDKNNTLIYSDNGISNISIYELDTFCKLYFNDGNWVLRDNLGNEILKSNIKNILLKANDILLGKPTLENFNLNNNKIESIIWQYYDKNYEYKYYSATLSD